MGKRSLAKSEKLCKKQYRQRFFPLTLKSWYTYAYHPFDQKGLLYRCVSVVSAWCHATQHGYNKKWGNKFSIIINSRISL
jgi:hypothetical protein